MKKMPQVLASFFESSLRWYLQLRFSSKRSPKNLTYLTRVMCFLPILIAISGGIVVVKNNIVSFGYVQRKFVGIKPFFYRFELSVDLFNKFTKIITIVVNIGIIRKEVKLEFI